MCNKSNIQVHMWNEKRSIFSSLLPPSSPTATGYLLFFLEKYLTLTGM